MNTAKKYKDIDGNELTIHQMVQREPGWAASRVQAGEAALGVLASIKKWDIDRYKRYGSFSLPEELRKQIQRLTA